MNNESEAQKKTIEAQITEVSVLKNELEKEKARVATGIEKQQLGSTGDGVRIEANSQHANSDIEGAEKPKEGYA